MHPGTTWWTATEVVLRSAFLRIWSAVLVHTEGGQRWFQPLMKAQILIINSRTEAKVPRRMAWRSMMPNQISTRLSHHPEVRVKWMWILGFAASLALPFRCLWARRSCP
jgi:hypothetical protein